MSQTTVHRASLSGQPSAVSKDPIAEEVRRYDEHLRDVRGLSAGTRHERARVIERLLRQKFAARPIDLAELQPEEVRHFLASQLDANPSRSNASLLATALRSYLRYRSTCGDSVGALSAVISAPVHWRLVHSPGTDQYNVDITGCQQQSSPADRSFVQRLSALAEEPPPAAPPAS